jgi:hypothetical protein
MGVVTEVARRNEYLLSCAGRSGSPRLSPDAKVRLLSLGGGVTPQAAAETGGAPRVELGRDAGSGNLDVGPTHVPSA